MSRARLTYAVNAAARMVRTLEVLSRKGHDVATDLAAARQRLAMLAMGGGK